MSDKRRATRYGAFFESADKVTTSKSSGRKSPSRNEAAALKRELSASPVKKVKSRPASKSPARSKGRPKSKSPARVNKKESASKSKAVKKEVEDIPEKNAKKKETPKSKEGRSTPSVIIEKLKSKITKKEPEKKSPKSADKKEKEKAKTSPKATRRSPARAAKLTTKSAIDSDPDFSPRPVRKTRKDTAALNDLKKSVSVSESRSVAEEYSDSDDVEISFKRRPASKLDEFKEFGGKWGCLALLLILPLTTYALHYFCTARICSFRKPNLTDFKQLGTYYNLDLLKIVLPFFFGVFTLNIFPLGRVIKVHTDRGYSEYQFNGLTLAILTTIGVVVSEYFKYNVVDTILRNYNQLLLLYLINALVQSISAYIRAGYVSQTHWNPFAKTGNFLSDFFVGREINPKWFSLVDIKLVHYHIALITTLVLNGIFIYKNIKFPVITTEVELKLHEKILYLLQSAKFDVAPLIISLLIIAYCLDLLIFEHHLSKTFELQYEGVGAGCLLKYATFPFLTSLLAKYVLDFKVKVDWWILCIITVQFLAALLLKRLANKSKNDFRWNPSKSMKLKSIPTFQGSRLLVDGFWKTVRQPNYTADILCYLSLLLVLIGRFAWPPLLAVLFYVALLVHRAIRLDARHANRYDSAWQRYTKEVKNLLIPHVF